MANTVIAVRSSGTAAATPSLGVIANGEIALNFADGIIYYKTSSNTLGSIRTTQPAGLTTEVQYNDAGSFGANANFTFNKTIATLNVKNINVSTNLTTVNLTATSITTGTGVGGIIAGANVIYSNVFVANSGGYIQFADGSKQYVANQTSFTNGIIAFNGTSLATLANTGTAGTYANASHVPVITTDAYGRVSAVTNTAIQAASTSVAGIAQLNDTITSTSTTQAATANSVKTAYTTAAGDAVALAIALG